MTSARLWTKYIRRRKRSRVSRSPWIDIRHGQVAATQQLSDLFGIDLVVLRLAAVDGFHVQGVAEDKGDLFRLAEIGQPVPAEHGSGSLSPHRGWKATPFLKIPRLGRSFAASSPYTLGTGPGPSQARP